MARRRANRPWHMEELQKAVIDGFGGHDKVREMPPKKLEKLLLKVSKLTAKKIAKVLIKSAPEMLARKRKYQLQFEARNLRRWRKAFDLIEMLWVCCEEIGSNFNQQFRPQAVQDQDFIFEAMTAVHAKSLLVVSEMICLMKGGFADAALTRWRTLHELNVVAELIYVNGQDLALRYLAHADVQAARDIEPEELVDDEKLQEVKRRSDYAIYRFGDDLRKHYGWACVITGKSYPNFEHLEKLVKKEDGRELYRHASQHIHSNHRTYNALLGVSESDERLLLVGPSNSGMVGPLTLAAMTLVETTTLYLATKPNFDRSVYMRVIVGMASRMHDLALRIEQRTLKVAQRRKGAAASRRDGDTPKHA